MEKLQLLWKNNVTTEWQQVSAADTWPDLFDNVQSHFFDTLNDQQPWGIKFRIVDNAGSLIAKLYFRRFVDWKILMSLM